jgi:ribonuclease HI
MNGKILKTVISLLTIIGIVFGAYLYLEREFARAADLQQTNKNLEQTNKNLENTNKRFEYKITQDALEAAEQRAYRIETAYDNKKIPDTVKEEYNGLKIKQENLKRALDRMETIK